MFKNHFTIQVEEEIEKKRIEEIILLQSLIRQYLVGIKIRRNFLRDNIEFERVKCAHKIQNLFKLMYDKNQIGIIDLKDNIIKSRENAAKKIQMHLKDINFILIFKN